MSGIQKRCSEFFLSVFHETLELWELSQIVDLPVNFENCGNYYKIQNESLSNPICAQNRCFATITKILK